MPTCSIDDVVDNLVWQFEHLYDMQPERLIHDRPRRAYTLDMYPIGTGTIPPPDLERLAAALPELKFSHIRVRDGGPGSPATILYVGCEWLLFARLVIEVEIYLTPPPPPQPDMAQTEYEPEPVIETPPEPLRSEPGPSAWERL